MTTDADLKACRAQFEAICKPGPRVSAFANAAYLDADDQAKWEGFRACWNARHSAGSADVDCPACNAVGYVYMPSYSDPQQHVKKTCSVCKGHGSLKDDAESTWLDEKIAEILANPDAVHINMLRGTIARPTVEQIIHLYGADALLAAIHQQRGAGPDEGLTDDDAKRSLLNKLAGSGHLGNDAIDARIAEIDRVSCESECGKFVLMLKDQYKELRSIALRHQPSAWRPDKWLVWSNEHKAWWRPDSKGYTGIIAQAGRYTEVEARAICKDGGNPRAWSNNGGPYEVAVPAPECMPQPPR